MANCRHTHEIWLLIDLNERIITKKCACIVTSLNLHRANLRNGGKVQVLVLVQMVVFPLSFSLRYDIMFSCWKEEPSERPSAFSLVDKLEQLLEHEMVSCL